LIDSLEKRLRSISLEEIERRTTACIKVSEIISRTTCFENLANTVIPKISSYIANPSEPAFDEQTGNHKHFIGGAKSTIRLFKPQQIHNVIGETIPTFVGKDTRKPLKLILKKGEEKTGKVIHFDQVQFVTGIEIESSTTTGFNVITERYNKYNSFEELTRSHFPHNELAGSAKHLIKIPNGGSWALGMRISLHSASSDFADTAIEIKLGFEVTADAFPKEMRNLNNQGLLSFASASNPKRLDQTFLTTNIANANFIEAVKSVGTGITADFEHKHLFQDIPNQTHNLIGEAVGNGISMYVHLMNRNENVIKNLPNWLKLSFDELILLDWSTDGGMTHLPGIWDDPRVRIIRVENQSKFIRTLAQNLASRMSRNRKIFKCDSDVEFYGDFFGAHPLEPAEFWVGEWQQARNNNERHLHGEVYYWLEDFIRIGGYDERIKSYGHDDTNFTDRLVLSGLTKKVFNYDLMHHQEHDQKVRAQGSHGIHPMVATYANRLMATYSRLWTSQSDLATFKLIDVSSDQRFVRFELSHQVPEETNDRHIQEAMQIVGSWYIRAKDLTEMSEKEINNIIWEKQLE